MTREEAIANLKMISVAFVEPVTEEQGKLIDDTFDMAINALEQEPCDDVCEWFEQYVDIATDIVELRFSDGTVKKAKRGLYMRDIEKSIRKMLIDQMESDVLNKIRAEIDEQYDRVHPYNISCAEGLEMALEIIDKYKAETE